ncbi:MarR family winged helix-turn-helix transcriptional regulator [Microbacterium sp. KUDC0406]|uniref:MarR family winged helix-turn-helix transcriptional regulator n=1 Tax=Microbacterium sp. KUDC0406 TaxID=2909588 RepID=UPI001F4787E6|nr:MarR family winged helix-turn-helix transcriptional regulator [Microbacterium sp. KUDC0406]UJP09719.1 MarR family winged helix-turn-helix transcriptional regulator [Microbacterium sp. KUDC0406]
MTSPQRDPADLIADALSRLRGRGPSRAHDGHGREGHGGPHGHGGGMHGHPGPHGGGPWGRHGGWGGPGMRDFPARLRMLEALAAASAPLGVSDLAEAIGVDQPRASRLVQQGVENGWVRREADPDDARRTRIVLTDDGRRMLGGVRGQRRDRLDRALTALSEDERTELARLLGKLADNWE